MKLYVFQSHLLWHFQLLNLVFPKVCCIYSKATTISGFKAFEVHVCTVYMEKFSPIHRNKQSRFWKEMSESWLLCKVWTGMTSSALETFPSCFLLSLRMLTLASLECQWSPLKVIYDVICDGLWYLRALQMTMPREGDATRPALNSHAYMCRETGGELLVTQNKHLPDFNTFRKFTGNQLKKQLH